MRLATRLLLTHGALVLVFLLADMVTVGVLVRLTRLTDRLTSEQIAPLEHEEALHSAAWGVETATRFGIGACERSVDAGPEVTTRVEEALGRLEEALAQHGRFSSPVLLGLAQGYRGMGERLLVGEPCERMRQLALSHDRLQLDEELTNVWIERSRELHDAIAVGEAAAHRVAAAALLAVLILLSLSLGAAALIARSTAETVTKPLTRLAEAARRVGEYDFSPIPLTAGPLEVRTLSSELERMRRGLAEIGHLKDAFVASVSHDLRTPLARLREALNLLGDGTLGPLNERQARVVRLAHEACEREIRMVSALLDLSRLRSGKPLQRNLGTSLEGVARSAMESVAAQAEAAEVSLRLERKGFVPAANLDGPLVERTLVNLLTNAVSASAPGQEVRLTLRLSEEAPPRAQQTAPLWATVTVEDDGPGVPLEARAQLFEPFFTRPIKPGAQRDGVGLGLPLAREMIRAHGGEVAFVPSRPRGATFVLWLPVGEKLAEGAEAASTPAGVRRS